ncbi:GPW/gp25 family protein [Chryseolinea sp. T2]|uniref:GPW/gp25 family protein n=1 Tax=Chryseolinea sp. T2 TaxID=3129255 RepID=UPI003076C3FA
MMYYTLPLKWGGLIEKRRLQKSNVVDSIREHIHLLFKTHFREYRFDYEYGSLAWDKDYEMIRSVEHWKNSLTESFERPLKKYEKRITQVKLLTDVTEIKILDQQTQRVAIESRKITLTIHALISRTNESFQHSEYIYFSPLSMG